MTLKLYVWTDVLCDYSCGIMFALAESEEQARKIIIEGCEDTPKYVKLELEAQKPEVYNTPCGFRVWGGG